MGDRNEQFRGFVAERSPGLLRLAYLLAPDAAAAEDLLQTALVRAYLRWRRIRDNPEGYVRRVLATVAADERRRAHHRRELVSAQLPEPPTPGDPFADLDGRDRLRRALAELPPGQRAAVVLRHWVGLSPDEAAHLLRCSPATVRSQTARGLDKLRAAYGARIEEST